MTLKTKNLIHSLVGQKLVPTYQHVKSVNIKSTKSILIHGSAYFWASIRGYHDYKFKRELYREKTREDLSFFLDIAIL